MILFRACERFARDLTKSVTLRLIFLARELDWQSTMPSSLEQYWLCLCSMRKTPSVQCSDCLVVVVEPVSLALNCRCLIMQALPVGEKASRR